MPLLETTGLFSVCTSPQFEVHSVQPTPALSCYYSNRCGPKVRQRAAVPIHHYVADHIETRHLHVPAATAGNRTYVVHSAHKLLNFGGNSEAWKRNTLRRLEVTTLGSRVQLLPDQLDQGSLTLLRLSLQNKEFEPGYWQGRRYIAVLDPKKNSGALKIPPYIEDFTWIRNAISHCSRYHAKCNRKGSQIVPGLVLIDCPASTPKKISIVLAPESCQYATLSYVWGDERTVPPGVPAVVQHAMSVTIQLGLHFLWVDRYVSLRPNLWGSTDTKLSI